MNLELGEFYGDNLLFSNSVGIAITLTLNALTDNAMGTVDRRVSLKTNQKG